MLKLFRVKWMKDSIFIYKDYGHIVFNIKSVMDEKGISINQVVKKTGLHHQIIRRYYEGTIERYDKEVLAKLCFVIGCDLTEIMHYEYPKN